MRRGTSKKVGQSNSNSSPADLFRSASSKASSKESERIDSLFYSYANASSGLIDPEGIETLCADLEVDHTDVRILMLAWKMKAEKQGYFNLEEWRRGLKALRADTISKLKKSLPDLEKEVLRPSNLSDFYSYAFRYCLTEEKQKSIDIESVCELLALALGSQFPSQVNLFVEYLKYLYSQDKEDKVLVQDGDIKDRWEAYFYNLFNDRGGGSTYELEDLTTREDELNSTFYRRIQIGEIKEALKKVENGKGVDPDGISIEVWKCVGEEGVPVAF